MAKAKEQPGEEVQTTVDIPDEDSVAAKLKELGAALISTADDTVASKETLHKIEQLLGNLQIKDYPQLAESSVVQTLLNMLGMDELRPGEVRNRGTLAERDREWTWRDVNEAVGRGDIKLVKFTPNENLPLGWNGLTINIVAEQEAEVPEPFYNVYRERKFALQQAQKHMDYLMGLSDEPPHPNWQTPEMAKVRAISIMGRRYGRVGGSISVGPINWETPAPANREGDQNG